MYLTSLFHTNYEYDYKYTVFLLLYLQYKSIHYFITVNRLILAKNM